MWCGDGVTSNIGVERYEYTESKEKLVMRIEGRPAALAAKLRIMRKFVEGKERRSSPPEKSRVAKNALCLYLKKPLPFSLEQLVFFIQKFLQDLHALAPVNAIPAGVEIRQSTTVSTHARGWTMTGSISA